MATLEQFQVPKQLLDPFVQAAVELTDQEFSDLVAFIREALLDSRVKNLCSLIPSAVPSGLPLLEFEACQ